MIGEDGLPNRYARYHHELVDRHLAAWAPPPAAGSGDRITAHPDVTFALRWTDRPAPTATSDHD